MNMINATVRTLIVAPLLILLGSCANTDLDIDLEKNIDLEKLGDVECDNSGPIQIDNFIQSWNQQSILEEKWTLGSYKAAEKGKQKTLKHCDTGLEICLAVQTIGQCVVGAQIAATDFKVSDRVFVTADLARRVVWMKLIRTFEPTLSQNEMDTLDTSLYENLGNESASISIGETKLVKYASQIKGKVFLLEATPLQYVQ